MYKQSFKITGVHTLEDLLKIKSFIRSLKGVNGLNVEIDPLVIEIITDSGADLDRFNRSLAGVGNYRLS